MTAPTDRSGLVVGVVGAGTMGAGIAHVVALAGHRTLLLDSREGAAQDAITAVRGRLERAAARGRLDRGAVGDALARLSPASEVSELSGCDLVVEAVVEDLDVKRRLVADLESVLSPTALLTTNTSSISIDDIAADMQRPGRFAGLHFFNPAPVMRLVEVVRGARTEAAVLDRLSGLVRAWGKEAVVCASTPGFVVNRVARPYYGEAFLLLAEGLDPETVDVMLEESGGFPMGPCELTDLIGQDVNAAVNRSVWEAMGRDPRYVPSVAQDALVAAGHLGRKTGRGFYDHVGDEPASVAPPAVGAPVDGPSTVAGSSGAGSSGAGSSGADDGPTDARPDAGPAPGPQPSVRVRVVLGEGLEGLAGRVAAASAGAPRGDDGDAQDLAAQDLAAQDGDAPDAPLVVTARATDGRTAEQLEAALGSPVLVVDLARDQATCSRIGVASSPGCPAGALDALIELLEPAGVVVTRLPDTPGLVVARTVAALVNAAEDAVESGVASAADVDRAMRSGAGYPVGPVRWGSDLGHRWVVDVLDALHAGRPDGRYRVCPTLRARGMLSRDRVSATCGIRLVAAGPGYGQVKMRVTDGMLNGFDILHGGMVFVLADTAFAIACNSHGPRTVGSGAELSWVSPAHAGDVLLATAVQRAGYGRNGLYDITITRTDGSLVAEVRGRSRTVGGPRPAHDNQEETP